MAQKEKGFVTKPASLSRIPQTHKMERTGFHRVSIHCVYGGQKLTCKSQFPPFTHGPRDKLRFPETAAFYSKHFYY